MQRMITAVPGVYQYRVQFDDHMNEYLSHRYRKGQRKLQGNTKPVTVQSRIAWLEQRLKAFEAQGDTKAVEIVKARIERLR